MFSKLTISLAMVMSFTVATNAIAQTKKASKKKTANSKTIETKKVQDSKDNSAEVATKAEEEKALAAKRAEEAKAAAAKAEAGNTSTGFLGYMKSHFSASYHGEYYFNRRDITSPNKDDRQIQDLLQLHNPTIIYRPIKNWKILATSEFKYSDIPLGVPSRGTYFNRHFRSLILVTRENVLTEKENGLKLDLGFGRRIFDRKQGAVTAASYGNNRVNASLGKKFGENLSSSMLVQYLGNDPAKGKIKNTTWKHSLELIPSITWQITEKLSYLFNDDFVLNTSWWNNNAKDLDYSHEMNIGFVSYQFDDKNSAYFQFKYLHASTAPFQAAPNVDDHFEYYIGHAHNFTPKITITGEVGSTIFAAKDGKDFFANDVKYPQFALYLDLAI